MFIDEAIVTVKAGDGGDGAATFRREKFVQFGGPDGGNGGNGGSIVFVADNNINTLLDFKYSKIFKAENGEKGAKKRMHGKSGQNLMIKVPIGTMVRDIETGKLLMDLSTNGEERVLIPGGRGGAGNIHFKSSVRKAPKMAGKGREGKELKVKLELKLLADVALVGYPSVGKSSLINKVSAAKSKVANYHFTTLQPKLGVVKAFDEKGFVIADIPGLIEGAHEGVGLGDKFLKHIERCKMIYHLVDVSGIEGRNAIDDFKNINRELEKFSEKLANKKQMVLANKMDLLYDEKPFEELKEFLAEQNIELYPVSVIMNDGLEDVVKKTVTMLEEIEREPLEEETEVDEIFAYLDSSKPDWNVVLGEDEVFEVTGKIIDNVLNTYVFNGEEGMVNFIHLLKNLGLETELRKAGCEDGDTVRIEGLEFVFVE
jgi:GTP-binding protein